MLKRINFVSLVLVCSLFLIACGGDDGGGNGDKKNPTPTAAEKPVDPWAGVGSGELAEDSVTHAVRGLTFGDGMTIGYDGTGRDEVVCRGGSDGDGNYEVCVSLDDDPYYIAPEVNFLVLHPLMFDRFGSYPECWTWAGDEAKRAADCRDVFVRMGGEGFRCDSGPEGGDKALRCTDGWSIAVNGGDDDIKTICRVHAKSGTGRCLNAPLEGTEDASLVLPMQMSSWDGYESSQDNERQFMAGEMAMALVPQDVPEGAELAYVSSDEDICTVDEDGMVSVDESVTAPAQCRVYLRVRAEGYADRILFADVPVLKASDVSWGNYVRPGNALYAGESIGASPVVSSDPSATRNTFESLSTDICTVDENGTLSAVMAGECTVKLTAIARDYLDVVIHKNLSVDALNTLEGTVAWSDFPSAAVVGTPTARLADPTFVDGDDNAIGGVTLSVAHSAGSCTWNDSGKVIAFTGIDECVLEVSATGARGYESTSTLFRVTPTEGTFALTWDGYASRNQETYGRLPTDLIRPYTTPSLAGVMYVYSATGDACGVDAATGALEIVAAGTCQVTVTASLGGYGDQSVAQTITVAKRAAVGSIDNPYGVTSLANGETLEVVNPPSGGVGTVSYSKSSGDCSVDGDGTVTANAASGACVVNVEYSGDENHSVATLPFRLAMVGSASPDPVWNSSPYPAATVGATVNPNAFTNASSGAGEAQYRTSTPGVCSVNGAYGALTGVSVGNCQVHARFSGNATTGVSGWANAAVVAVGKGTPVLAGRNTWGSSPSVKVGQVLDIENALDGYGAATFNVKTGSESFCSVDGTTGAVTGVAPGSCIIQVTLAEGDDYLALATATDAATITVTLGEQTLTVGNMYGDNAPTISGSVLAVSEAPVASAGDVLYRVSPTAVDHCDVSADGSVVLTGPGECVVQVRADATDTYAATDWTNGAVLEVTTGSFTGLSWNPATIGRMGEELELSAVATGESGATILYSVIDAGNSGCSFKGRDGADGRTLIFTAHGRCRVEARAVREHFSDWSQEASIRVRAGAISATVNPFASGEVLKVGASTPVAPAAFADLTPADATTAWTLVRGERDCVLVNAATGAVRAKVMDIHPDNPPECSVQLTARKNNYELYRSEPVHIPLSLGELGELTAPVYSTGATLLLDGHADMVSPPTDPNGVEVSGDGILPVRRWTGTTFRPTTLAVSITIPPRKPTARSPPAVPTKTRPPSAIPAR